MSIFQLYFFWELDDINYNEYHNCDFAAVSAFYFYFLFASKYTCCFILIRWWHDWLQYVSQETACIPNGFGDDHCEADSAYAKRPSCIDNSNLIFEVKSEDATGNVELQDALMEGRDYVLVPQEVWKRLHNW